MKFAKGNLKLGKDTLIFNMGPAVTCPSKQLGLCKLAHKCYAMKAERQYPNVLPYRYRQAKDWDSQNAIEIMLDIEKIITRAKKPIKFIRFNESGDFRNQADVDKLNELAKLLDNFGLVVYGYTARSDLDFNNLSENLIINGTYFRVHNTFIPVQKFTNTPGAEKCHGKCETCDLCKARNGKDIEIEIH